MEHVINALTVMAALSLAVERITEAVKKLLPWLAKENANPDQEQWRQVAIHVIAIAVGWALAASARVDIFKQLGLGDIAGGAFLLGAAASSGSSFWNSLLDTMREVSKQKEQLTQSTKKVLGM